MYSDDSGFTLRFFTNLYSIGSGYGKTIHISNTSKHYPWPHAMDNIFLTSITVSEICDNSYNLLDNPRIRPVNRKGVVYTFNRIEWNEMEWI